MTDQELIAFQKETSKQIRENTEQMKKTDEQMKKTDAKLIKLGLLFGNMSNNKGEEVEEYFYNSLISNTKIGDMSFDIIDKNTKRHTGNVQDEFDIILINGNAVAILETKYKIHPNDIERLRQKIENFRILFPVYKDYKLYAGMAGFIIPDKIFDIAKDKGYFILQRKGDIIKTYTENMMAA